MRFSLVLLLSVYGTSTIAAQSPIATQKLQLTLPPAIYAVPEVPTAIFFDNIVLTQTPADYQFDVTCDIGRSEDDRWLVTPTSDDVGDHKLTIAVSDKDGKPLETASTVLNVVSAESGDQIDRPIRLLIIGDSLTNATAYPNEIARLLSQAGNPKWEMLGTNRPGGADAKVGHEGYGGWTWHRFATHYEPKPDPARRKRSSPFVFLNDEEKPELNFPRYLNKHCDGVPPDYVVIMLGINDCFHPPPDDAALVNARIDTMFDSADQLLAAIRKAAPKAEIGFCLTTPPNARQAAFEANYKDRYTRWGWKRIQHRLVERQLEYVKNKGDALISIVPTELNLDPVDGYPVNNGVHPNGAGYKQIGATIYSWLKWKLSQSAAE